MTLLISMIGATGLLLAVSGVPPLRAHKLAARVEPYLGGLHGRPSGLLHVQQDSRRARLGRGVESLLGRFGIHTNRDLPARLRAAGLTLDAGAFRLEQLIWGASSVIVLCTFTALVLVRGLGFDVRALPPLILVGFYLGWLARDWRLTRQVETRRDALEEELPSAIDLVTLSIMAGESVPAAFARAGAILEMGVGEEFRRVVADVRAGAPIVEALEDLQLRVPAASIGRFIEALISGIERGSPLADVLRAQADDGREAGRRHLLEMGGRREVLMLVPVVFLIMPVVVVFALFPGLVSLDLLVP